ncbi:MAG: hypothetical protein ACI92E_001699, partial [Oceanicoccus sp.]
LDVLLLDENNLLVDRSPTMFVLSPIHSVKSPEKVIACWHFESMRKPIFHT